MTTIRPEVTSRHAGASFAAAEIGHNRGPPLKAGEWIELQRIVDLKEASRLSGLSIDSLKRHYRSKFVRLSERRFGMRVADALMLADESEAAA
jgi:hypothetical protein